MTKIIGNKVGEALFNTISETFIQKGIPLSNMQFNGMDSTNTMSEEISGLLWQFRHALPQKS